MQGKFSQSSSCSRFWDISWLKHLQFPTQLKVNKSNSAAEEAQDYTGEEMCSFPLIRFHPDKCFSSWPDDYTHKCKASTVLVLALLDTVGTRVGLMLKDPRVAHLCVTDPHSTSGCDWPPQHHPSSNSNRQFYNVIKCYEDKRKMLIKGSK